jgi:endonuclease YncB( thermonuclease family)
LRPIKNNIVKFSRNAATWALARWRRRWSLSFARSLTLTILLSALLTGAALLNFEDSAVARPEAPLTTAAPGIITGSAAVVDGDTLDINDYRIRLYGIDAPESAQTCRDSGGRDYRCGLSATRALSDRIAGQVVSCQARDVDRYGRVVAVCRVAGEEVNRWLTSEGWAVAYRRYSRDYVGAEEAARAGQRGLWAGTFTAPEEWRHGVRTVAADSRKPDACVIKGNISKSGERIYHVPGGYYYDATRIDPSRGERMFCTEAEARAAGWRRSKR